MDRLPGSCGYDDAEEKAEEDNCLYDSLLENGVLNDVHSVAESVVSSSVSSADLGADAQRIADRLLERNAEDIDRALDAIVRDVGLSAEVQLVDFRWPRLLEFGPCHPPRKSLQNLNALVRLPFTYDTYTGAYFRKLTKGLEQAVPVDALFGPAIRVYAKLVDMAPDSETSADSFGSLCEATHLRCLRPDFGKSVTSVCLLVRCLSEVCKRGAGSKFVKSAVVEFVATIATNPTRDNGPYVILCCADPLAMWFDNVSKYYSSRTAFFECLDGDRRLLKTVVSGFFAWMTEPEIPESAKDTGAVVKYACFLHATHLLAKMYRYRSTRTMFPVKVTGITKIHAVSISTYCLGFLSANRDGIPATLARALCKLVAVLVTFHTEVLNSVIGSLSKYGICILADVMDHPDTFNAVVKRQDVLDELFKKKHWKVDSGCLIQIAAALSRRHEEIWRIITKRMSFLKAIVGGDRSTTDSYRLLMTNMRCTPLGILIYDLGDVLTIDDHDWLDPRYRLSISLSCTTDLGKEWLNRNNAYGLLNKYVEHCLKEVEISLDPNNSKSLDLIVDAAYSYCASIEGLMILLDDNNDNVHTAGKTKLSELYYLLYEDFDDHLIVRDVLIILWLRLIEVATHSFSLCIYADLKLKYQDTLLKLSAENRTENGLVFVDETTGLLTKLQRSFSSAGAHVVTSPDQSTPPSVLTEFLTNTSCHDSTWLQRVRTMAIRSDQISETETMAIITSFGRRRFDGQLDLDAFDRKFDLTDFDVAGIRLALRYGSSVGLVSEGSAPELEQLYGSVERREPRSFDCTTCTLFMASRGSRNECVEACAVLLKLEETAPFFWPTAFDRDTHRSAAFGHLIEELLQRELPEVHNAFKMSGVSWWLLCSNWAFDCFWGRLSWSEICRWLCLIVLFSVDYQAFFFVCLASTQKRRWLEAFNQGRFRDTVYQCDFGDFRLADCADYMEYLVKKYQRSISKRLVYEFDMN